MPSPGRLTGFLVNRPDRRLIAEDLLVDVMIVQPGLAPNGLFEVTRPVEAVSAQYVGDAAMESLDHAVGGGLSRPDQPVLDLVV